MALGGDAADRRFRRYHLFGRFWRADWPRFREVWRLGLPIAVTLAFEVTIFNAAVFLMGLIGAEFARRARHRASRSRRSPSWCRSASRRRRRCASGSPMARGDRTAIAPRRLDRLRARRLVHGADGDDDAVRSAPAGRAVPRPRPIPPIARSSRSPSPSCSSPPCSRSSTARRRSAPACCAGCTTRKVPMVYAAIGYWGVGLAARRAARLRPRLAGRRRSGRARDRARPWSRC